MQHMKIIVKLLAVMAFLLAHSAYAKEIAVLLPVTGPLTPFEKTEITQAVVEGLAKRFDLKHGEDIDLFVKKAFQEESQKSDCDETNCYRRIAAQYHAEKIVGFRIVQITQGNYFITAHLYDVMTGDLSVSEQRKCAQCSIIKFKELCKELTDKMAAPQPTK